MRWFARGELVLALIFVAVGALWIFRATRMPLWQGFSPDSGFLPLVYGSLLAALALAVVAQMALQRAAGTAENLRKPLIVMAALIAAVAALPVAGFLASVFVLLLFLYAVVERLALLPAVIASAAITGGLFLIFKVWLGVPLPSFFS